MIEKRYGTLGGLEVPVQIYDSVEEADKAAGKPGAVLGSANDNFHYRGGPAQETRDYICTMLEDMGKTYPSDNKFELEDGTEVDVKAGEKITRFTKPVLDAKTKQPRKDKDGNVLETWAEAEGAFARRFMALMGWDDLKQFQPNIDSWAKNVPDVDENGNVIAGKTHPLAVDAKAAERKPAAPRKLAAKYKDIAAKRIQEGTIDEFNQKYLSKINRVFTPTGDTSKMYAKTAVFSQNGTDTSVNLNVSDADAETLGWLVKEYIDWAAAQTASGM
jgi:hypothetical protein